MGQWVGTEGSAAGSDAGHEWVLKRWVFMVHVPVNTLVTVPRDVEAYGVGHGVDIFSESLVVNLEFIVIPCIWEGFPSVGGIFGIMSTAGNSFTEVPCADWAGVCWPSGWHGVAVISAVGHRSGTACGNSGGLVHSALGPEDAELVLYSSTAVSPSVENNSWVCQNLGSTDKLGSIARSGSGLSSDQATGIISSPGGEVVDFLPVSIFGYTTTVSSSESGVLAGWAL